MSSIKKWFKMSAIFMVTSISCFVSAQFWFDFVPVKQIVQNNPSIKYMQCVAKMPYEAAPFEIAPLVPNKIVFDELFILSISQGRVQGKNGHILIGNKYIYELFWADRPEFLNDVQPIADYQIIKVSGRVAVIAQELHHNYFHFIHEVLGRLALLEMQSIEYDWLYIAYDTPMIKKILSLWGIDPAKIISPIDNNYCVQADELIVPSLVLNTNVRFNHMGALIHPKTMQYVQNKLVKNAITKKLDTSFSSKVFISRKDSSGRGILNEDEIFKLFEPLGFVRYELSKMTLEQQVLLFQNAEVVVGEHGAGFTNIVFCKPKTIVIELFQALVDTCFWWLSRALNLQYFPIKTFDMDTSYVANWRHAEWKMYEACSSNKHVPLDNIYPVIEMLKKNI